MSMTVFVEVKFWLLVAFSFVVPVAVYVSLLLKRAVSPITVLVLALALVAIAGVDVYLLRSLNAMARATPSTADDVVFLSELSVSLYLLPALFAGTGINVMSHVLIRHLAEAEQRFENGRRGD
jgi:hypothetical protein